MQSMQQRRYNFFDKELVKDPQNAQKNYEALKDHEIIMSTSGRGVIIFGSLNGIVLILNKQLVISSFKAFDVDLHAMLQLKNNDLLILAGTSDLQTCLKLFKLERVDSNGQPMCLRSISIPIDKSNLKVTCMATHESHNYLAVGCSDGTVVLIKGDLVKDRMLKPRILFENQQAITGLAFKDAAKILILFVTTETSILTISIGFKDEKYLLSSTDGCKINCSVMTDSTFDNQFLVARSDAIYAYNADVLGPCYPFEGEKVSIHWFRGKIVIVSREASSNLNTPTGTPSLDMTTVNVYDVKNWYVGFSGSFSHVVAVVCEWGAIYVVANGGKQIFQLSEKDTQSKLQILFKKNLYSMAIDLARSHNYDDEGVKDIIRQYADHLYMKGDFEKSITQYIETIGHLEPSYVIRKFLDSQRITNLTDYLHELHKKKLANEDHTTLLLNCYTKLKDETKLNTFLATDIEFDVDTAVKVLRQSGFSKQALNLCKKHLKHEDYLKIQLDDSHDYLGTLNYIRCLDEQTSIGMIKQLGTRLMNEIPKETLEFLKSLVVKINATTNLFLVDCVEFFNIFLHQSQYFIKYLEFCIKNKLSSSPKIYDTLLELYVNNFGVKKDLESIIVEFMTVHFGLYDINQALVLFQLHNFTAGLLFLYEKQGMNHRILQHYIQAKDYSSVIETCKKYESQNMNLWIYALQFLSKQEDHESKDYLSEVIAACDRHNLLTPMMIVKLLSKNGTITFGSIKEFLLNRLRKEENEIHADQELVSKYSKVSLEMKSKINQLKYAPLTFQANKCEYCKGELDFPSIHCLCSHSFHAECFENHSVDDKCPTCTIENSNWINLIQQNKESKENLNELFHKKLDRSVDKFEVIAEFLGKGLFNKPS